MTSLNAFFRDVLSAPLLNSRWSWGAVDYARRRVFLRVWRDELSRGSEPETIQILKKGQVRSKAGWNERVRHIGLMRDGYQGFGVLCDRKNPEAGAIADFDEATLLMFGETIEDAAAIRIEVRSRTSISDVYLHPSGADTLASDLADIASAALSPTTRKALVDARLGQGSYRRRLLAAWGGTCAVTACPVHAAIRASHCKPWRLSDQQERLDPNNGLPLVATLDALFDAGLITFDDDGAMQIADVLTESERFILGLPAPLRHRPTTAQAAYLAYHYAHVFAAKQ